MAAFTGLGAGTSGETVTLQGLVLDSGNLPGIHVGFEYGTDPDPQN